MKVSLRCLVFELGATVMYRKQPSEAQGLQNPSVKVLVGSERAVPEEQRGGGHGWNKAGTTQKWEREDALSGRFSAAQVVYILF